MLLSKKIDYIITQVQESKSIIPQDSSASSIVDVKHKLKFKNPVKELFFIIQTLEKMISIRRRLILLPILIMIQTTNCITVNM